MKITIITLLILGSYQAFTSTKACLFSTGSQAAKISWTAYKTPEKVGVSGTFDKVSVSGMDSAELKDFIGSLQFSADTQSVNSKNAARDKKLYKFFFSAMKSGQYIRGFVTKVIPKDEVHGKIEMNLWLNGVVKKETLEYDFDTNSRTLHATGSIDLMKYSMNKPLKALNKACFALHKGKTWSDVTIEFTSQLKACHSF